MKCFTYQLVQNGKSRFLTVKGPGKPRNNTDRLYHLVRNLSIFNTAVIMFVTQGERHLSTLMAEEDKTEPPHELFFKDISS